VFLVTLLPLTEVASSMTTKTTTRQTRRRNIGEIIQRGRIWYIRYYDGRGRRRLESTHSPDRADAGR